VARTCTVCTHPQRGEIDRALVAGAAVPPVAARYGLGRRSVQRHKEQHLPATLTQAQDAADVASADSLMAELRRVMARVQLLSDACDRWLRDPENDAQYDVGPRSEDVRVIYSETAGGKTLRKRARLSALLERVAQRAKVTIERGEYRHADPRELILKTAAQTQSSLELLAKLIGELDERPQLNVLVSPEWHRVRAVMLAALRPYPEARAAVALQLAALEPADAG
jgi:hypothetical protein